MNLTCDIVKDLSELYKNNEVSDDSGAKIEEHLKDCKSCREYYKTDGASKKSKKCLQNDVASDCDYTTISKRLQRRRIISIIVTSAVVGVAATFAVINIVRFIYNRNK